jgi:hypothetical protein
MAGMIDPSFRRSGISSGSTGRAAARGDAAPRITPAPSPRQVVNTPVYGPEGITHFTANTHQYGNQGLPVPQHNANLVTQQPQSLRSLAPVSQPLMDYEGSYTSPEKHISSAGGGAQSITQDGYENQELERLRTKSNIEEMEAKARLSDEAFSKRMAMFSSSGGDSGGGDTGTGVDPAVTEAARAAAFARAKDQAGQTGRAALDAIQNVLGATGRLGGGYEADAKAAVVGGARADVNEFTRDQLMSDLDFLQAQDDRQFSANEKAKDRRAQERQSLLSMVSSSLY